MRRVSGLSRRLRVVPLPLCVLLVIAVVHGGAWSIATAPLGGPDEDAHVAYAQYLAETGDAPQRNTGTGTLSSGLRDVALGLNTLPIKGHPEGRPFWTLTDEKTARIDALPWDDGSGPNPAGSYPPAYYAYAAVAYHASPDRSLLGRIWSMRFAGVLLFALTTLFTWLAAAELLAAAWQRTLATAVVALQPKFGFMAGVVNPDIALCAVGTAALWIALRVVRRGPTLRRAVTLGALAALAALCHPRGLYVAPFAVLAVLVGLWRFRPPLRTAMTAAVACAGVALAGLFAAVLWTRAHAAGAAFGTGSPVTGFNLPEFISFVWQFYLPPLDSMVARPGPEYGYRQVFVWTYFGSYGWLEINLPSWVYASLQVALGVLALWVFGLAARRAGSIARNWPVALVVIAYAVGLMLLLHVVSYGNLRGAAPGAGDPVITGRYLLPLTPLLGCAFAWVAGSLPRPVRPLAAGAAVGALGLLAISGVGTTLARFYA